MPPASGPRRVKKTKPKPKPNTAVFGPLGRADAPIRKAQSQARKKTQAAERKIQRKVVVPYVPKLKNATPAQRGAAQSIVAKGLRKQGITTKAQVKALPPEQRKRVNRATGYAETNLRMTRRTPQNLPPFVARSGDGHRKISAMGLNVDLTKIGHSKLVQNIAHSQIPAFIKGSTPLVKAVVNDAGEIVTTTPSSLVKLGDTAIHHPKKVPGMLAAPYKELYHHPKEFAGKHPLSTALMLAPAVRGPGLTAGKVLRVGGKQTLERDAATLPGTALKEAPKASRDAVVNALQKRKDRKAGPRTMTKRQVQKRVDEAYGAEQKHRDRIEAAILKKAKPQIKATKKGPARDELVAETKAGAASAAKAAAERAFAREFGATAYHKEAAPRSAPRSAAKPEILARSKRQQAEEILREAERTNRPVMAGSRLVTLKKARADYERAVRAEQRASSASETPAPAPVERSQRVFIQPKNATGGVLHDTREAAQAVADALNRKPLTIEHGGFTKVEKVLPAARKPVSVNWKVSDAGGKYAVYPDFVAERLKKQRSVGTSMAPGAKLLRQSRGAFTRTVLPYRPTWLSGQAIEGTLRAAIQGAGPTSFLRARKLRAADPELFKQLSDRAVPAGKIGKVMKEFAGERKTLAEDFPGNPIAESLTSLGKTPGIKQVRNVHHAITQAVFKHLNGSALEAFPQTVMLGRALKKSPLMDGKVIGLSDKAIQEAAKGLRDTRAQNDLAREVQRAYGKYSNFGPALRESIVHWTPFIPWSLNAVRFLASVLPRDHPVLTALIADVDAATEEWRQHARLSLHGSHLPFFDMGGYPTNGGKSVMRLGHYTPFGVAVDPTGGLASMVLPQFTGAYGALKYGVDWKGQPLRHGGPHGKPYTDAEKWLYGLQQLGEAMIPLAQQGQDLAQSDHPLKTLQHELRVISSTRVQPKDQAGGGGLGGLPQSVVDALSQQTQGTGLSQDQIDALAGSK